MLLKGIQSRDRVIRGSSEIDIELGDHSSLSVLFYSVFQASRGVNDETE